MSTHAANPARRPIALSLFGKTLVVSLLFHLSAITIFSIVIYFPRQGTQYFRLAFVEEAARAPELPVAEPAIVKALTGGRNTSSALALDLPDLSFDPQGQLGLGKLSLGGKSFFEDQPEAAPDSWARFGTGIQLVRASILGLTGADTEGGGSVTTLALGGGLRALADWGNSASRELLYAPPVLSGAPGAGATEEFLITVDASGGVMRVLKMSPEESAFADATAALLGRCRFAASTQGTGISTATVRISPQGSDAP